ncbi:hypothetical protein [Streptomyces sp. NPDC051214]|uniref:hypothetical protein n=1 Tax=Streptomyces sp. NPDC051214 TaxID=3155282 RepID=UPI003436C9B8
MSDPDLRKVVDSLPALASLHGLHLIPASVGSTGPHAVLSEAIYDCPAFARLAADCGARILYWDVEHFDAGEFTDSPALQASSSHPLAGTPAPPPGRQSSGLLAAAKRHDGDVEKVQVAFVIDGVIHTWTATAPWAEQLHEQWEAHLDTHRAPVQPLYQERAEPDPVEAARIAAQLRTMPAVIRGSFSQRHDLAAATFPPADGQNEWDHRRLLRSALSLAHQAIQDDADHAYQEIEQHLDDTAAQLLRQNILNDAYDAPARRIVTTDFLTELTGGHKPKTRTVTLLLGRPAIKEFITAQKSAVPAPAQSALPL